ncbi:TetR/AcrR family transcriptional regulator [Shouchella lehensis]|uniref:HTH-type, TetR family transcriptional regulator n=1 Tax=Shouchella lehensis G1 TaxID=1246626 RepID=A0A060LSP1_9BACI|nr:TetR/AcrR family transcriptional regulator [Shouchella lehensis]AIC93142.1 HTH-type, TetR family transcriptional regulator [Shouchella lehensis G1]
MSKSTKENMIETMAILLQKQGYHGTGLNEVIQVSGSPKGSIYHHFPGGKEALAVAAIQWTQEQVHSYLTMQLAKEKTANIAIAKLIEDSANQFDEGTYFRGVPMIALTLENASSSEAIRLACKEAFEDWERLIAEKLMDNGLHEAEALRRASVIHSMMQGAAAISFAKQSSEPLRLVATHISI